MSTEANAPAAGSPEQAHEHIMTTVYHPVFFNKLADHNLVPTTQREAEQFLYIGRQLFAQHQEKAAAAADERGTFLDFAVARLDGLQGGSGGYDDGQVKRASADLIAADPATLGAAMTLLSVIDSRAA